MNICWGSRLRARFIPVTPILRDRAITLSLTFLPGRITVETTVEFSKGFGWVSDSPREPGLRDLCDP